MTDDLVEPASWRDCRRPRAEGACVMRIDIEALRDPNFTGGLDPVEYLRRFHEGELVEGVMQTETPLERDDVQALRARIAQLEQEVATLREEASLADAAMRALLHPAAELHAAVEMAREAQIGLAAAIHRAEESA